MSLMVKVKFYTDKLGTVLGLIEKWKPSQCEKERDYKSSLYTCLSTGLEGIKVTREFGRDRARADIVVADKVIVELKHNLISVSAYQRLIGQLDEYKSWDGPTIIVVTGEVDPDLIKRLVDWADKHSTSYFLLDPKKFTVVRK